MKLRTLIAAATLATISLPSQAEFFGTLNGRSANLDLAPNLSVEAAFITGDYGEADYQNIGARINYKASPLLMVYGDFGLTEIGDFDGNGFGIGAYYMVEGLLTTVDFAAKFSFHKASVTARGFNDFDIDTIVAEGLFSGQSGLGANGDIGWYGNIGIHRVKDDGGSETEIGFGGGLIMPLANGEVYGGIDLIDELQFGIGYRHFIN